ncbi:helix-turn-helix transcriptional regulator [Aurantimonas sp. A3-2-R12]|uniref:helix-turn-helix transcriptional regulator n=1 Tax=Aurantimonas sp. A3-2-R12 TaxID=3114362 RepID=UPI002E19A7F8|nr:helix-turn-helix transcriptional regulator [Aurantimonas sp. A3-2-R12]
MSRVVFDSSQVEPRRQFELFYQNVRSNVICVTPERLDSAEGFRTRVLSHRCGAKSAHVIEAPSHSASRTRSDIRSFDPEEIHVSYMVTGGRRIVFDDIDAVIPPGRLFAADSRAPFHLGRTGEDYRGVKLALPLADMKPNDYQRCRLAPERLKAHRLHDVLCSTFRALDGSFATAGDAELSLLVSVAECLVSVILRDDRPDSIDDRWAVAFRIIELEIDRSLADAEFGLSRISRRLGLSSRYVQRVMLRHDTAFSTMLRERRMDFARGLLSDTNRSIEAIASASGYSELSAFYRAFKRCFGVTPGEFREASSGRQIARRSEPATAD